VKDRSADASDLLVWKWLQGDAAVADFGDPLGTGDQALCIWDGGQNLLWRGEAPAGGMCGSAPCWKALGGKGYRYKNGAGTPDGLSGVLLGAGVGGKAKLQVKGKGALLAPPAPAFALPVRVQLQSEGGRCWEAQYGASGVLVNSAGSFKGKGQ
jgi:hypothetical protein